jgi:hypothetical protein
VATREELQALAKDLRHAQTRLLPLEVAERVQHAIVRLEELDAMAGDPSRADEVYRSALRLLDECRALLGRP